MSDTDLPPHLDLEFAYTSWADSCQDIYNLDYQCRRPALHEGDHAAGFGTGRITWAQGVTVDEFFDYDDKPRRGLRQRINDWIGRH